MAIRITTLCENTAGIVEVNAEYGLSMLIETGKINVLFDTGAEISASSNAEALDIDLNRVDKIVLSHGHADHTGGLGNVLNKINKKVEIIAHPAVWSVRYNRGVKSDRFTGIPYRKEQLECLGANFNLTTKPVRIADNVMTTGEIPMSTDFENVELPDADGYGGWVKSGNELVPDEIIDDQALIITLEDGLVVVLGCAHRGIINTIYHAQKLTGIKQVYAVLGGAHLKDASEERLWQTIGVLRELDIKKIGLCHCTGLLASGIMAQEFGDRFFYNNAGTVLEIP